MVRAAREARAASRGLTGRWHEDSRTCGLRSWALPCTSISTWKVVPTRQRLGSPRPRRSRYFGDKCRLEPGGPRLRLLQVGRSHRGGPDRCLRRSGALVVTSPGASRLRRVRSIGRASTRALGVRVRMDPDGLWTGTRARDLACNCPQPTPRGAGPLGRIRRSLPGSARRPP